MPHGRDTTCVAFVPGFMQRADTWSPIAARLARHLRPALVELDTPSLEGCIDRMVAAATGGAVVAYSMGGRIALHAAARHPGGFRALVLVGATPGIEREPLRRSRRAADNELAAWMETVPIQAVVEHWEARPIFATQDPRLVAAQRPGRLSHDPTLLAAMLRATGQGALDPLWERLPALALPVLAVAGEEDQKYADVATRMAAALPHGSAAIVGGAGHAVHLEQPEVFGDLLVDFLDEHLG